MTVLLALVVSAAIAVSVQQELRCLFPAIPGWTEYINAQYGFSIRYPTHVYFRHVTVYPNGRGILFDTHPDNVPYHEVDGATIDVGVHPQQFVVKDGEVLNDPTSAAENDRYGDANTRITSSNICGNRAVRSTSRNESGMEGFQNTFSVYFSHKGHIVRARLIIGTNYVGTLKEREYKGLFEHMLRSVRMY